VRDWALATRAGRRGVDENARMRKRSYGTGSLSRKAANGTAAGGRGNQRVKRAPGPVRKPGSREGLTRSQAERVMRRRMESEVLVVSSGDRVTVAEAGARYVDHLEHVMERKRTTIQDYRGYLSGHLDPYFGDRWIEKIDGGQVMGYLKRKRARGSRPRRSRTISPSCTASLRSPENAAGCRRTRLLRSIAHGRLDRHVGESATCSRTSSMPSFGRSRTMSSKPSSVRCT
jgi:hypothetical protein